MNHYIFEEKNLMQDYQKIERKALIITITLNVILSIVEIVFFFLTDSTSVLFDGIFSMIMTVTTIIALVLGYFVSHKNFNYPFGKSVYNNIFTMFKSLLIFSTCVVFLYMAINSIVDITVNNKLPEQLPNFEIYIAYVVVACVMSLVIYFVYYFYNKKIDNKSIILTVERKSCIVDFGISFSVGIALIIASLVGTNDIFIREIVDKSLTIAFVIVVSPPIVKLFIEQILNVAGCRMHKNEEIELKKHLNQPDIIDIYIQKHNEHNIFLIKLDITKNTKDIRKIKKSIDDHIYTHYSKNTEIIYIF